MWVFFFFFFSKNAAQIQNLVMQVGLRVRERTLFKTGREGKLGLFFWCTYFVSILVLFDSQPYANRIDFALPLIVKY